MHPLGGGGLWRRKRRLGWGWCSSAANGCIWQVGSVPKGVSGLPPTLSLHPPVRNAPPAPVQSLHPGQQWEDPSGLGLRIWPRWGKSGLFLGKREPATIPVKGLSAKYAIRWELGGASVLHSPSPESPALFARTAPTSFGPFLRDLGVRCQMSL